MNELSIKQKTRDNREIEEKNRKIIMKTVLFENLSQITPILAFSRVPDLNNIEDLNIVTHVDKVEKYTSNGSSVIMMEIANKSENKFERKNVKHLLFSFRGVFGETYDPFVCITKHKNDQVVFAYANDDEFIVNALDGDELTVIKAIQEQANKEGMRLLERYSKIILKILEGKVGEVNK